MDVAAVAQELKNDPAGRGYDLTGPVNDIINLLLGRVSVANPEAQGNVAKPITAVELIGMLSQASLASIEYDALVAVREAADANDLARLGLQLQIFTVKSWITPDETTALTARIGETIPDPSWEATIPGPSRLETVVGETGINKNDLTNAIMMAKM